MDARKKVIEARGLRKEYRLGQYGRGSLTADLQSWWARVRGREDPNATIGEAERIRGDRFMALQDVSFDIYQGDTVGIVGGNGAGKSTLLKILARITAPTEGRVAYNGRISSMLEVGTGFSAEMTGRENIYLNGAILGMNRREIDDKLERIIEFSECGDFIDTPVKRYSSGMYVKLAFSVAAHLDSEILLMDEVLAVGDVKFQKKCLDKMRSLAREDGRTVLYVSHNMDTIRSLCNTCLVMEAGNLKFFGPVDEGIALYLDTRLEDESRYDLRDVPRYPDYSGARLLALEYVDKRDNRFATGEKMRARVTWEVNQPVEEIYLRFDVFYTDHSPVGISLCALGAAVPGQVYETVVEFDCTDLQDGNYIYKLALRKTDVLSSYEAYDVVRPELGFTIEPAPDAPAWNHVSYGHLKLRPLRVLGGTGTAANVPDGGGAV